MAGRARQQLSFWHLLSAELLEVIASFLPRNIVACTLRLVNKDLAKIFQGWRGVNKLSEPTPHHFFTWYWSRPEAMHHLTLKQRQQLLILTARSGSLENLQAAIMAAGCCLVEDIFTAAAKCGHLEMCQWLAAKDYPRNVVDAADEAARQGHLEIVLWLAKQADISRRVHVAAWMGAASYSQRKGAVETAAWAGHDDIALWLLTRMLFQQNEPHDDDLHDDYGSDDDSNDDEHEIEHLMSLEVGYADAQQASKRYKLLRFHKKILEAAACGFELEALQRVHQTFLRAQSSHNVLKFNLHVIPRSLESPTSDWSEKVAWLLQEDCEFRQDWVAWNAVVHYDDAIKRVEDLALESLANYRIADFLKTAVCEGNLSLLEYLRDVSPWLVSEVPGLAAVAAEAGRLDILRKLLVMGWRLEPAAVSGAAQEGHLDVLKWLLSPEAQQFDGGAVVRQAMGPCLAARAAKSGKVEIMEWLGQQGCVWDKEAFKAAAGIGKPAFLEWMAAHGCPMGLTGEPYVVAASSGDMLTFQCLKRLGCPWDRGTFQATAGLASPVFLEWLLAKGCATGDRKGPLKAGGRGDMLSVQCLKQVGCPRDKEIFNAAAGLGDPEFLEWLVAQGCSMGLAHWTRPLAAHVSVWVSPNPDELVCKATLASLHRFHRHVTLVCSPLARHHSGTEGCEPS
ncbi:hypothetical protein VOLCADRAFT_93739 [Volvox carteri f. nagariensis]|uniref:F-box domain-containing protein n=1 Tax=Volvox carteri f. nagariensis TaxID=3068 RepID=D8U2X8_VOLCA|nr:uncharacterized protein VOLCADRAFT_93739 [Volvox carteri f. nagariensis]EFJ45883.1 hypothetical protein VOLCADRAFT_93739 [Volvox carteri f. nagariensis]|eukprot:XP_002952961.1 hypothetical protein VOLCADRAFT_93739 [Volvox carteri f. nagariensis]